MRTNDRYTKEFETSTGVWTCTIIETDSNNGILYLVEVTTPAEWNTSAEVTETQMLMHTNSVVTEVPMKFVGNKFEFQTIPQMRVFLLELEEAVSNYIINRKN